MSVYSIPKDFIPITEKQIIKDIAEEKGFTVEQIQWVYDVMLKFLSEITTKGPQIAIKLKRLGTMYYKMDYGIGASRKKRIGSKNREELKAFRDNHKLKQQRCLRYQRDMDYYWQVIRKFPIQRVCNHTDRPIVFKYGLDRRNRNRKDRFSNGSYPLFDVDSLFFKQMETFFKNDVKYGYVYSGTTKYKDLFFGDWKEYDEKNAEDVTKFMDDDIYDHEYYKEMLHNHLCQIKKQRKDA